MQYLIGLDCSHEEGVEIQAKNPNNVTQTHSIFVKL